MIEYRRLAPSDLGGMAAIDRSDYSDCWCAVQNGAIVFEDRTFNHPGFSQAHWDDIAREFGEKLARDEALLFGAYDGETMVGISGLETDQRYGADDNLFNFSPLWISKPYRGRGIGRQLFTMARQEAEKLEINGMYVSAAPVPGTVDFYTKMGCQLLLHPDPALFAKEPEDIHMVLAFPKTSNADGT